MKSLVGIVRGKVAAILKNLSSETLLTVGFEFFADWGAFWGESMMVAREVLISVAALCVWIGAAPVQAQTGGSFFRMVPDKKSDKGEASESTPKSEPADVAGKKKASPVRKPTVKPNRQPGNSARGRKKNKVSVRATKSKPAERGRDEKDSPASEKVDGNSGEVAVLREEIAALREAMERAGVAVDPETEAPVLTAEQRERRASLLKEIEEAELALVAYREAVEGGLDPRLVERNIDETKTRLAALRHEIAVLESPGGQPSEDAALREAVAEQSEEIASLKAEIAAFKAVETARREAEENGKEPAAGPFAKIGELLPIELFAFGDFFYVFRESGDDEFAIGQLELDLSQDLGKQVTVSVGVAFDGETFGVGAFTIDGRLVGKDETHLIQADSVETSGILCGQFDVPFGIDYLEYASISRSLVTGPLAVERTHAAWNDLGGQFYLNTGMFNGVVFVVNGVDYETIAPVDESAASETGEDPETAVHEIKVSAGTRLGVRPVEALEIGASFAGGFAPKIGLDMVLVGGDIAVEAAGFSLKGEYIFHYLGVSSPLSTINHGFYATAMYQFEKVFFTGRYSAFMAEKDKPEFGFSDEIEHQLSIGVGVKVLENASIRMEYTSNLESGGSEVFVQLVGGTAWQPTGLRR